MRIAQINLNAFKGATASRDVGELNILTGPNGSGKTALLCGILYAARGQTPLGDTTDAVRRLAGPTGCSVGITLTDDGQSAGFAWRRRLRVNPRTGEHKTELMIVGQEAMGIRQADPLVRAKLGDFAPMFRLSAFLDLSAEARRNFVLRLCSAAVPAEEFTPRSLAERAGIETMRIMLGPDTADAIAAGMPDSPLLARLLEQLEEPLRAPLSNALAAITVDEVEDLATAIASMLESAKGLANANKRKAEEGRLAARRLSERKAEIAVSAGTAETLREELDSLGSERGEIDRQLAEQRGREKGRVALTEALEAAGNTLLLANESLAAERNFADPAERRAVIKVEIERLERETVGGPPDYQAADRAFVAASGAATEAEAVAQKQGRIKDRRCLQVEAERMNIASMESSPWAEAERLLVEMATEVYRALEQVPDGVNHSISQFRTFIRANLCPDDLAAARSRLNDRESQLLADERFLAAAKGTAAQLQRDCTEAHSERIAVTDRYRAHEAAKLDLKNKGRELGALWTDRDRQAERLRELAKRIGELGRARVDREKALQDFDSEAGHIPVEQLDQQLTLLDGRIAEVHGQLERRNQFNTLDAELVKCIASAEQEQVTHEVATKLAEGVRAMREPIMCQLVRPLLDRIDRFLAVATGTRAYCELVGRKGKPVFEFGWIVSDPSCADRKVALDAMSGGENAIFCAALAYALVMTADPPLKLLLLEGGEVDAEHLSLIMAAIEAVRDDLSNVFLTTHLPAFAKPRGGWNVIDVTRPDSLRPGVAHTPMPGTTFERMDSVRV